MFFTELWKNKIVDYNNLGDGVVGKSRTRNVSINTIIALVCQVFNLVINFITRTVFIYVLGAEYLGINGLFTNILTILSFAELGIGNAIVFNMYKPLATGDKEKIKTLMDLYKKAYIIIGLFVAIAGLCLTPFLKFFIKDIPDVPESILVLYILFLINTAASYFFVYKKNIIIADQKNYIVLIMTQIIIVARTILQILFLYLTRQFIIYLIIQIICTLVENIACSLISNRIYPYLREKAHPLEIGERNKIFYDVKALAMYKFGSVILNGTDNILISAMISVREVGLVSNYVLLTTSCNSILQRITDAFTSSVGNLNATESPGKQYEIFEKIFFITSWIYGYASVGLIVISQSFIKLWIGEDYLLETVVLLAIVAEFYVKGTHSAAYIYRVTLGFFVEGRWSNFIAAGINIVMSLLLGKWIGLEGIFIATSLSRILSVGIADPVLIFSKGFKRNVSEYYIKYLSYFFLFIVIGWGCICVTNKIEIEGWTGVIVDVVIVTIIFNLSMFLIFMRTKMFEDLYRTFFNVIKRKK
jgi:Membrane protein involved in the export of O-antigen and teichoic acid